MTTTHESKTRTDFASPLADVAGPVFMQGAAGPSSDTIYILVALGRVLGKVDPGAEHAPDVGVALVKALVDDGVDERRTCGMGEPQGVVSPTRSARFQGHPPGCSVVVGEVDFECFHNHGVVSRSFDDLVQYICYIMYLLYTCATWETN